jgi:WD40 repeat protein
MIDRFLGASANKENKMDFERIGFWSSVNATHYCDWSDDVYRNTSKNVIRLHCCRVDWLCIQQSGSKSFSTMSVILATAGFDHRIRFWEAPSGICQRILKYPDSQVNKLEITPDKVCRLFALCLNCLSSILSPNEMLFSFSFLWTPKQFLAGKALSAFSHRRWVFITVWFRSHLVFFRCTCIHSRWQSTHSVVRNRKPRTPTTRPHAGRSHIQCDVLGIPERWSIPLQRKRGRNGQIVGSTKSNVLSQFRCQSSGAIGNPERWSRRDHIGRCGGEGYRVGSWRERKVKRKLHGRQQQKQEWKGRYRLSPSSTTGKGLHGRLSDTDIDSSGWYFGGLSNLCGR